jgi:hypothetical protein
MAANTVRTDQMENLYLFVFMFRIYNNIIAEERLESTGFTEYFEVLLNFPM